MWHFIAFWRVSLYSELRKAPVANLFRSREVKDQTIIEKLKAIGGLSEYNPNVVEIFLDSIIEKDKLKKSQAVMIKKRLEELNKVREK